MVYLWVHNLERLENVNSGRLLTPVISVADTPLSRCLSHKVFTWQNKQQLNRRSDAVRINITASLYVTVFSSNYGIT